MKRLLLALAVLALAACGQTGEHPQQADSADGEADSVILGSTQNLPDWLLVARQRDCPAPETGPDNCRGEVHFNQRTITRSPDGAADIWIQVRHAQPQLFSVEDATTETTVRFTVQRLHYRFNCTTEQFVVVERQIMGANETVVARDEPTQIYRAPVAGSITAIIMPIACRGS
jgi:hypothetical protein